MNINKKIIQQYKDVKFYFIYRKYFSSFCFLVYWILKKINSKNKREFLIIPTKLRLEFWSIYCKRRYQKAKSVGLARAILNLEEHEDKKKL